MTPERSAAAESSTPLEDHNVKARLASPPRRSHRSDHMTSYIWNFLMGVIVMGAIGLMVNLVVYRRSATKYEHYIHSDPAPTYLLPIHYDLRIEPYFDSGLFQGQVTIVVNCTLDTNMITMYSVDLLLKKVQLISPTEVLNVTFANRLHSDHLELRIIQGMLLKGDIYNLTIAFSGNMRRDRGSLLFEQKYLDASKKQHTSLSFVKVDKARLLFPCFDVAGLRATFDVELSTPNEDYTAISSGELLSTTTLGSGQLLWLFGRTPPISPEQLAIAVTDMPMAARGRVAVWSTKSTDILNLTNKVIETTEQLLGVRFPCKTLSLIIVERLDVFVPTKWCAAVREVRDLCSFDDGFLATKRCVTYLTTHVVYFWFDTLVDIPDSKDLWLKMTLAVFYAYKVIRIIFPTWAIDNWIMSRIWSSMSSYKEARIVKQNLEVHQLGAYLNATIWKSYAFMQMIERAITPAGFAKGITWFLTTFAYGLAHDHNIYEALDPNCSLGVIKNLSTWERKPSYPLITFHRVNETALSLTQELFNDKAELPYLTNWILPVSITTQTWLQENPNHTTVWITSPGQVLRVPKIKRGGWIFLNSDGIGYFRVKYDNAETSLLIKQLLSQSKVFTPVQRALLINDLLFTALAGHTATDQFTRALEYIENETAWLPLMVFLRFAPRLPPSWTAKLKNWNALNKAVCSRNLKASSHSETLSGEFSTALLYATLRTHCCSFDASMC